jgi:hypothetical protein
MVVHPPSLRDSAIEAALGIADARDPKSPGADLIGYHASGLAPICRVVLDVPVVRSDVFVDLGAGRGKVLAIVRALTGARVRGVELQRELVDGAVRGIELECADVRAASLDDGTVFFLYTPFIGAVLAEVLERLHAVARRRAIVVCALGLTLPCPWLVAREGDAFWLTIYDSVVDGVAARAARPEVPNDERLERLAFERR